MPTWWFLVLLSDPPGPGPLVTDHRLEAPADRQDRGVFYSPPSALHLTAHTADGGHYYRFPEVPVTPGLRYRLRFRYLLARGTEGECRARVSRYHDTPAAWKSVGSEEVRLAVVGRWVAVDRPVDVGPDTNSVALDFRVESDSDCGELWVDDLSLAPVGHPVTRGP